MGEDRGGATGRYYRQPSSSSSQERRVRDRRCRRCCRRQQAPEQRTVWQLGMSFPTTSHPYQGNTALRRPTAGRGGVQAGGTKRGGRV